MRLIISVLFSFFLFIQIAFSATYYVDFDTGNDVSAGTSTVTAWKTIPGTRTTDGSAYLNAAWGPFTTSANVPSGTIFQIKAGTTHVSAAGGYIWVNSDYYDLGASGIVFQSDASWGTGSSATFDGAGMTIDIATFLLQIDGATVRGLNFHNATREGLHAKEKAGGGYAALVDVNFYNLSFSNNGTIYTNDSEGSGSGQLNIRWASTSIVSNCWANGNQRFINGFLIGDAHKYPTNVLVTSCVVTNHRGDLANNDSGIGFKALNGIITFSNCISADNLKGFDLGEDSGDNEPITYTVINSTIRSNIWGVNFNGPLNSAYSGAIKFYLINSLVYSNGFLGNMVYSGPYTYVCVHNTFAWNGTINTPGPGEQGHVQWRPDGTSNEGQMRIYAYNNIFSSNLGATHGSTVYFSDANSNWTLDADYNSYEQGTAAYFWRWGYFQVGEVLDFEFGVNGPGRASGNWYSYYGNDTTPPSTGLGHYHNDANSKGTGATDTTLPPLDFSNYTLTNSYSGLNLSSQSWYIPIMGVDRNGVSRENWDLGAYEYRPTIKSKWKKGIRILRNVFRIQGLFLVPWEHEYFKEA